jgi:hypothetical protein
VDSWIVGRVFYSNENKNKNKEMKNVSIIKLPKTLPTLQTLHTRY